MGPWGILAIAGVLEVVWALGLKYSEGFTRLWPSVITLVGAAASFWLLSHAMKSLPAGTAYAVWTGIGALGVAVFGMILLGEGATPLRLAGIGLIVAGIVALKLA
ncbi:quaternary ammonium compound efflux SMR transporter SugE [Gemmobacter sp.]|uniref:quaternary ammonium compound efflux SMR transporter SugE n=1 Tax=Gemmobacter sp. TaxID=1898957 RepID=UPI002AFE789F|nr:quaternary ammonium compound efflux SMR transporter SugE [Gemmobacter sp.]